MAKTATLFFKFVRSRQWPHALGLVSRGERQVFLKSNGEMKAEARQRLSAIDTSSWQALTLMEGKLTGVVLLIPPAANANSRPTQGPV